MANRHKSLVVFEALLLGIRVTAKIGDQVFPLFLKDGEFVVECDHLEFVKGKGYIPNGDKVTMSYYMDLQGLIRQSNEKPDEYIDELEKLISWFTNPILFQMEWKDRDIVITDHMMGIGLYNNRIHIDTRGLFNRYRWRKDYRTIT